jgi:hypothetical protein
LKTTFQIAAPHAGEVVLTNASSAHDDVVERHSAPGRVQASEA